MLNVCRALGRTVSPAYHLSYHQKHREGEVKSTIRLGLEEWLNSLVWFLHTIQWGELLRKVGLV